MIGRFVCLVSLAAIACARPPEPVCGDYAVILPASVTTVPVPAADPDTVITAPPDINLVLNIPAYEVRVLEADSIIASYQVAVGSARYPTRTGTFSITSITWNPWWRPPPSDWARNEKVTPPGPTNPMGKVKLNYGAAYYLHGTPDSTRLGRAVSHGCVRMQNADAIDLALRIQDLLGLNLPAAEAAGLRADWGSERTIGLEPPVPLEIRYDVVELRDSTIYTYRDIYKREASSRVESILSVLANQGTDPAEIDSAAVLHFVREAGGRGQVAVRTLLRLEPVPQ